MGAGQVQGSGPKGVPPPHPQMPRSPLTERFSGGVNFTFIRKNANLSEKRWKNVGKGEVFTVLGGKNIILEKGEGQNYPISDNIYTPDDFTVPTTG